MSSTAPITSHPGPTTEPVAVQAAARSRGYASPRGRTERETCDLNGWGIGTVLRGHEQWGDARGIWTTIRITALGEENILARTVFEERTGPDGQILCGGPRHDREGTWTLDLRDWQPAEEDLLARIAAATTGH